jgi:hypothetical protein
VPLTVGESNFAEMLSFPYKTESGVVSDDIFTRQSTGDGQPLAHEHSVRNGAL